MKTFKNFTTENMKLINKIKNSGVVKTGSMSKYDTPAEKKPVSQMSPAEKEANAARRKAYNDYQKSKRNEEAKLDELSTNTLSNYMVKSTASAGKRGASARTQDKRIGGQKMADDKLRTVETEGLEQDGPRKPNTPDGLSKNFGKTYGKKASAYLTKKVADRNASHAKQDPGMVKKGYGPAVVDREKAQAKRAKRYKKLGKI